MGLSWQQGPLAPAAVGRYFPLGDVTAGQRPRDLVDPRRPPPTGTPAGC